MNSKKIITKTRFVRLLSCLRQTLCFYWGIPILCAAAILFTIIKFYTLQQPMPYVYRKNSFDIDREHGVFLKDGKPFRYISGSMHYFRIPKIYWRDRLLKAKAVGLNAIQTYVAWNFHEPSPGVYNFDGNRDVYEFISLAKEVGLLVLLRAGPYICGEWDFGGLPAWLLSKNPQVKLRTSDPDFLNPALLWFRRLLPRFKPFLYENGGPIIMVQIENEYGFYPACDKSYLTALYESARVALGEKVILYTTDTPDSFKCGSSDRRLFTTIDFGVSKVSKLKEIFRNLENFQPNYPLVNNEYYTGWIDHWGEKRSTGPAEGLVRGVEVMWGFSDRVSFNFYMFHGGTNFAFWNGKNSDKAVTITSYDYDAPLSEAGDITIKYEMLRASIRKLTGATLPPIPPNVTKADYGTVSLDLYSHMLYNISGGVESVRTKSMEALGCYRGFLAYTTSVKDYIGAHVLSFRLAKDIQHVFTADRLFLNLVYHGSVRQYEKLFIRIDKYHPHLAVLSESQGHINFGNEINGDSKGVIGAVYLNDSELLHWKMKNIEIREVAQFSFNNNATALRRNSDFPDTGKIFRGVLFIPAHNVSPKDTFARFSGFNRGILMINGRILGRFFPSAGPQVSLYVPASSLVLGNNTVTVLELDSLSKECRTNSSFCSITFEDHMAWLN